MELLDGHRDTGKVVRRLESNFPWDPQKGMLSAPSHGKHRDGVLATAYSPEGRRVVPGV